MSHIFKLSMILLMFLSLSFAQMSTKNGLGFEFHSFPSSLMEDGDVSMGIYLPIKAGNILFEPYISQSFSSSSSSDNGDVLYSEEASTWQILAGMFTLKHYDNSSSYIGCRGGREWTNSEITMFGSTTEYESAYTIITPTMGIEYYINDSFSFSGEVGYRYIIVDDNDDDYDTKNKSGAVTSRFIVRFYM